MPRNKPTNIGRIPADPETLPTADESRPDPAAGAGVYVDREKEKVHEQRKLERKMEDQATAKALNEETRRIEETARAEVAKENDAIAEQIAALTVDELVQGVDLALENMAAGLTQSEAVRRAAETIKGEKVAPPQE